MKFWRALAALAVALSTAIGLAGTAAGQAVKNPDTLVVLRIGDPESLDPAFAYDTTSYEPYLWHIYETLIFFDGTSTGTFVPMLATEVPSVANGGITKDGRTYVFKIREGARFHDGSPLTADDVRYSLLRFMFMDRDGGPSGLLLGPILGVDSTRDAEGNFTPGLFTRAERAIQVKGNAVSITLHRPFAPFLSILATWSMVTSKRWAMAQGDWDGTAAGVRKLNNPERAESTPLFSRANGTGPFRLAQWDRQNRQVILERNDDYWRAPARLRRVIIRVVPDFGTRRLMLQQGDADIIAASRANQTQVEGLAGARIVDGLTVLGNVAIFMNMKIDASGGNPDVGSGRLDGHGIPPDFFADVNVRRGFAQAFDDAAAVRDCYRGNAAIGRGPIPKGLFGYSSSQRWYGFDRERAASAFREARGGQVWTTGFKLTVLFNSGNANRECLAQVLKAGVEALNPKFKVDVRSITWAQYLAAYRQSRLPVWITGWTADFPDPDNFVTPYLHSAGAYASAQGYKNPDADRLIEEGRRETDPAKRRAVYAKLQEIAHRDVPAIWVDPTDFRVMRTWVRGWYRNPAFPGQFAYFYTLSKQ
ncbi:MAG: ABC transporter substrate-binding protein [Armatimonadota bacterium]|nr:ABC transporter substrate-binding protein [Armatimonadota bacterium]